MTRSGQGSGWRSATRVGGSTPLRRVAPLRALDDAQPAAATAATEQPVAAVGLESGHAGAGRHLEPLEHLAGIRRDAPQFALLALPGAVPELAVDPRHAGHEPVRLDGAE